MIEKVNKNQDQEYVNNISEEYSFAKKRCQEMLNENGGLPNMFNPYNKSEVSDYAPTQTVSCDRSCSSATVLKKEDEYRIRKLTPKECWRLMGFSDEDFYKAKSAGVSDTQLYKQAGNSIVTCVLYSIYKEMYTAMPYLFEDLKLGSYFSGIGAFEKALDKLYETIESETDDLSFTEDFISKTLIKVGNIYHSEGQNGNVYDENGVSPTISSGATNTKGNGGIGSSNAPKVFIYKETNNEK